MTKHISERSLVGLFLLISILNALLGHWGPASYFLFLAAFVDFEDWTSGGRAEE